MDKIRLWIRIISLIGIFLAVYLLYQQYTLPENPPCTINQYINCDAIISGEVARTFGIPTPIFGLVGYLGIFFAATYKRTRLLFGLAAFGLTFCLWIAYKELVILKVICPVCILCQILMISVFGLAFKIRRHNSSPDASN
jgi:uncharacterized membrane protein